MIDGMIHTDWSRRALAEVRAGRWTKEDWHTFCERAGRGAESHNQARADWDAWFETAADVAERNEK